jgi:hypothetical protein
MTSPKRPDPLEPVLRESEAELKRLLRETCIAEANGVTDESSAAIRHLEDTLLAAAVAAEQTITLRRHIREKNARGEQASVRAHEVAPIPVPVQKEPSPAEGTPPSAERMREFRDPQGRQWRAWSVTPGRARGDSSVGRYLGEYHKGWICFETLDSSARRRLPCEQAAWRDLTEDDLRNLLEQAISAPPRKSSAADHADTPAPGKAS